MKENFEWDENKRISNLEKHKIDFNDATRIFNGRPVVHVPSEYRDEDRWLTIGELSGRKIMVVWTWRGSTRRIITARRLRKNDKRKYHTYNTGRSPPEQGPR